MPAKSAAPSLAPMPANGASSIIYLGTPEIAVAPLQALVAAGCNIQLVITRPDTRRGRGKLTSACPVKQAALELGLRVSDSLEELVVMSAQNPNLLGVVIAYGAIIPMDILSVVPMINVHFSLLPRWRGAAPVERAILAGDAKTGVSIMRIVEGLDQGEVYSRSEVSISATDTLESLRKRLVDASLPLLISAVKNGVGHGVDQTGEVSYAKKISADELRIDWSTSAVQIDRLIRVGGAYTNIAGKRIKIVSAKISPNISSNISANQTPGAVSVISKHECEVATSDGVISLTEVQPEGKSVMTVEVWLNGARIETGAVFG